MNNTANLLVFFLMAHGIVFAAGHEAKAERKTSVCSAVPSTSYALPSVRERAAQIQRAAKLEMAAKTKPLDFLIQKRVEHLISMSLKEDDLSRPWLAHGESCNLAVVTDALSYVAGGVDHNKDKPYDAETLQALKALKAKQPKGSEGDILIDAHMPDFLKNDFSLRTLLDMKRTLRDKYNQPLHLALQAFEIVPKPRRLILKTAAIDPSIVLKDSGVVVK